MLVDFGAILNSTQEAFLAWMVAVIVGIVYYDKYVARPW